MRQKSGLSTPPASVPREGLCAPGLIAAENTGQQGAEKKAGAESVPSRAVRLLREMASEAIRAAHGVTMSAGATTREIETAYGFDHVARQCREWLDEADRGLRRSARVLGYVADLLEHGNAVEGLELRVPVARGCTAPEQATLVAVHGRVALLSHGGGPERRELLWDLATRLRCSVGELSNGERWTVDDWKLDAGVADELLRSASRARGPVRLTHETHVIRTVDATREGDMVPAYSVQVTDLDRNEVYFSARWMTRANARSAAYDWLDKRRAEGQPMGDARLIDAYVCPGRSGDAQCCKPEGHRGDHFDSVERATWRSGEPTTSTAGASSVETAPTEPPPADDGDEALARALGTCPFCGTDDAEVFHEEGGDDDELCAYVSCTVCRASGPRVTRSAPADLDMLDEAREALSQEAAHRWNDVAVNVNLGDLSTVGSATLGAFASGFLADQFGRFVQRQPRELTSARRLDVLALLGEHCPWVLASLSSDDLAPPAVERSRAWWAFIEKLRPMLGGCETRLMCPRHGGAS